MRDITRIPRVLKELEKVWENNPDLRLGQLFNILQAKTDNDLFYIEDEKLVELLKSYLKQQKKDNMNYEEMTTKNEYRVEMQIGSLLFYSDVTACTQEEAIEQAKDDAKTDMDYGILNPPIDSEGKIEVLRVKIKKSE